MARNVKLKHPNRIERKEYPSFGATIVIIMNATVMKKEPLWTIKVQLQ